MSISKEKKYDLVDFYDQVVRIGTKQDAKKLKLFTRSVHILLIDRRGKIMVCERPPSVKRYPNQITSSAGGHVEQGENYKVAAVRELKEELGINTPLTDLGRFNVITSKERAIHHLFIGKFKKVSINSREINSYKFLTSKTIKFDIKLHPRKYAKPFHEAFEYYLKQVK